MSHLKEYILNNFSPNRPSTCIVNLKKNKDGMLDELEQATSFLNGYYKEISVNQRLHHYLNGMRYAKLCKYCDQPLQIKPFNARISGELKAVGKIFYEHEGKSHRYYPDIFVIPDNKIVEVKSNYTYNISKSINLLKKEACIKLGLDFTFEIR